MARMKIFATIYAVAILVFSVSVYASDTTLNKQPAIMLAATDHQPETAQAESGVHGNESAAEAHDTAGGVHGSGHANLGVSLPLWSCIPFAGKRGPVVIRA